MPVFDSIHFGPLAYREEAVLAFPRGLPGFESCRCFLALTLPRQEPLVYLQSLEEASLCFLTLPVLVVDRGYRLAMSAEDLRLLGFERAPRIGEDVLCLAVLSIRPEGPTANLLAPVVVNLRNRLAVQAVAPESDYSHRHPVLPVAGQPEGREAVAC